MDYTYQILVIDDTKDIENSFKVYQNHILDEGIKTFFTLVTSEEELKQVKKNTFDVLMVDYNLKNGFFSDNRSMGTDFIKSFREKNRISKIIFYSSEFEYSGFNKKDCKLNLHPSEIFELINTFKVNSIVSKSNFDMIIGSIIDNIKDLDPIAKLLINTRDKYDDDDFPLFYTTSDGNEMNIDQLLHEYQADSDRGKEFREQLLSTVVTLLLEYKY